jgi:hypothetical protein
MVGLLQSVSHVMDGHDESVCGGDLLHWRIVRGNSKVSMMRSLAVDVKYTF